MLSNTSKSTQTELKVIEPIKNYLREFNTPEEFNLYYVKHKDEIDDKTTNILNKMYHIDGYRITKIKNVLMLKKYEKKTSEASTMYPPSEILEIKNEINELKQTINNIIKYLHSQSFISEGNYALHIDVEPPSDT